MKKTGSMKIMEESTLYGVAAGVVMGSKGSGVTAEKHGNDPKYNLFDEDYREDQTVYRHGEARSVKKEIKMEKTRFGVL